MLCVSMNVCQDLTQLEIQVLESVMKAGALTVRRVIARHGPKPNWQGLLKVGLLREYQTAYGAVLAGTRVAHQFNRHSNLIGHAPYLTGPASVVDRAYQMDALALLEAEGYTVGRHEYKRSGKVGYKAGTTSQIVRTVLRVSPKIEAQLRQDWDFMSAPRQTPWGIYAEALGYPSLYASISSGGLKLPRLRALYRQHRLHIHEWRHPLLLAVPEEGKMRAYIRSLEAERARIEASLRFEKLLFPYPLIRLIILPVP